MPSTRCHLEKLRRLVFASYSKSKDGYSHSLQCNCRSSNSIVRLAVSHHNQYFTTSISFKHVSAYIVKGATRLSTTARIPGLSNSFQNLVFGAITSQWEKSPWAWRKQCRTNPSVFWGNLERLHQHLDKAQTASEISTPILFDASRTVNQEH